MKEIDELLASNPVKDPSICLTYGHSGKNKNECSKEYPHYEECRQRIWDLTNLIRGFELQITLISEN